MVLNGLTFSSSVTENTRVKLDPNNLQTFFLKTNNELCSHHIETS